MLDFAQASAQKQFPVQAVAPNSYGRWRSEHAVAAMILRDGADGPTEKLLQAIWQQQRLRRDQLRTLDGQTVRVLHPGFASLEGGPDFRGAVLQFGSAASVTGDVEIDLRDSGWRAHGHDRNPAFQRVILQVVWAGQAASQDRPILAVQDRLDAPLTELAMQLETHSLRLLPPQLAGQCCAPFQELEPPARQALLREAALFRLQNKAAQFRARAQHVGWDQALWEGLFRALGYKNNVWGMQCLAETRARWLAGTDSPLQVQARLFGLSGLLPTEPDRAKHAAADYLRRIWEIWWREQDGFADGVLPREVWRLHGLRPANQPLRRLALAAHWCCNTRFIPQIEKWCQTSIPDAKLVASLVQLLAVAADDFWSWHWTFRSARLKSAQPLLGAPRITDLAVNAVLPWLLARAQAGHSPQLVREMERRYDAWPVAEDNSVLRLARQRLLGRTGPATAGLRGAWGQQGLLQITRDYCAASDATCSGCRFPELVRHWRGYSGS